MRALVVALVLSCSVVAAARADAPGEARAHYHRGLALYNEGRFAAARVEFEAGYQLQPLPLFLFNAAQAARRDGDARGALALYRQFVAADPQSAERAEAEAHIAELSGKVPEPPVATPPPAATSPQDAMPSPAIVAPSAVAVPSGTVAPAGTAPVATAVRAPARRDVADAALMTVGAAGVAAGAVLLGIGGARLADAQSTYGSFDEAHNATPLVAGGAVLLGAGTVLVLVGAIRYSIVKHHH